MMVTTEPDSSTSHTQLDALLHRAAIAPLDDTGWLRVTGSDRVRWLNGMVTNSIQALEPGQGCYNFLLNAQGRIQGTATAFALEDAILLETDRDQVATLLALLYLFIIMDDVELSDATGKWCGLVLTGSAAASLLAAIDLRLTEKDDTLQLVDVAWHSSSVKLIRAHGPLVPRFELWSDAGTVTLLAERLRLAGALDVNKEACEALRVLEGTPRYGVDIRNSDTARDLPQETNQTRALHFAKGCYLGQEIVERIRSRGQVHRTFIGFRLEGELAAPGTLLHLDGKPAGELTSIATFPLSSGPTHLALGYIRREALERNTPLSYPGGEAIPASLPFRI